MARHARALRSALEHERDARLLTFVVQGHPFWREFFEYLAGPARDCVSYSGTHAYFRLDPFLTYRACAAAEPLHDVSAALDVMPHALRPLAEALDLSAGSLGSPMFCNAWQASGEDVARRWFSLRSGNTTAFVAITRMPRSCSPARHPDVPWVFPVAGNLLDSFDRASVFTAVAEMGLEMGVSVPAVRVPLPPGAEHVARGADALLDTWVFAPRALDWLERWV
jgi:hypothetical protein